MKKTSKTVVFFGNERLATGVNTTAPTLRRLIEAGYTVKAAVSNYAAGTSRNPRDLEIQKVADTHNIPVLLPDKPTDILQELQAYAADIGVLVAYGKIIPQSVIDIFPYGIVNIHPSLLPLHRGPTPIESVILDGSERTGVSIMKLVKAMDAGPVYAQSELDLDKQETKQELADTLLEIGGAMLLDVLPGILEGTIVAVPQDDSRATYDNLLSKSQGIIDWAKPARQIVCEIRAFSGWPKSRTNIGKLDVIITSAYAKVSHDESSQPGDIEFDPAHGVIVVSTAKGNLCIEKLQVAGKKEMAASEFARGYSSQLLK